MEFHSKETMMEEREELMLAPGGGKPTLRRAHFLKPTSKNSSFHSTLSSKAIIDLKLKEKNFNVTFPGWRRLTKCSQKEWERWVHKLQPVYGETWKKVGIFDAILASTCIILKRKFSKDLMLKLAEKWCPETNIFLFSWGESTVTLEDVKVLGGLPVLGQPAWGPQKSNEMLRLDKKLRDAHTNIHRNTQQAVRESTWLDYFDGGDDEGLEHEAFIVLWLTRYIFAGKHGLVSKDLFLIAINLSRGIPVALAPAVLASIYRDLGTLKKCLLMGSHDDGEIVLCSPLGLVQVWVWERFPNLSPSPNPIKLGEPRLSRWHEVNPLVLKVRKISKMLDSSGEDFLWRPYTRMLPNWDAKKLYNESEMYVMAGSDMDSEAVQVWIRCWRYSELSGIDCGEKYLPHRVGMQFGFDQEIPGLVGRLNGRQSAWRHFNRPVGDAKVYLPARLFESDSTKRYQVEWNRAHQMQVMRYIADDVSVSSQEGEENGDEDDSEPEMMETTGFIEDRSGPENMEILGMIEESSRTCRMREMRGFTDHLSVSSQEGGESGDEDDSEPEMMEIPGFVDDHSEPGIMKIAGCVDDHSEPEKLEILGGVGDDLGPGRLEIPEKLEVPSSEKNDDPIPVKEKSRSSSKYSIQEVRAMVSKLEKTWAGIKAKRSVSVAK